MALDDLYELHDRTACHRVAGRSSIVEAVDYINACVVRCREAGIPRLMINGHDVADVAVPSLVDRFLAVEEWATSASGLVAIALVVHARYIRPDRFGVKLAADLGLMLDVCTTEDEAMRWLDQEVETPAAGQSGPGP